MGSISRRGKGKGTVLRGQQGMTSSPRHEGIDTLISRPAGAEGCGFARGDLPFAGVLVAGGDGATQCFAEASAGKPGHCVAVQTIRIWAPSN